MTGGIQLAAAGTPAGAIGRQVRSGEAIFIGDRIRSGNAAAMQVVLLDETVFTIGADSDITVDEFVYNPATGAGTLTASVGRGAFRFVTGKIAQVRPESMTVKTPIATIGVRGTMMSGFTTATRSAIFLNGPGAESNAAERRGSALITMTDGSGEGGLLTRTGWQATAEIGRPVTIGPPNPSDLQLVTTGFGGRSPAQLDPRFDAALRAIQERSAADEDTDTELAEVHLHSKQLKQVVLSEISRKIVNDIINSSSSTSNLTTYADLRTIGGTGSFSGSGTITPSSGGSGSYTFSFSFNFGSRSFSGSISSISVSGGPNSTSGGGLSFSGSYGAGPSPSGQFLENGSGSCSGVTCTGQIKLLNSGGTIAKTIQTSVTVSQSGAVSTGSGNASRP